MTSRTSLFNIGIYKSTVRRYIWGAVLYAILLFMITSMSIFFSVDPETHYRTMAEHGALILDSEFLHFPLFISFVVPTVVALLIYRFVHSKKAAVFVHSLPVSRCANYISSVAAALTLMAAPIILNGIILIVMSVCGYGAFFDVSSCLIWTGANLLSVFLMFSVATLAAFLTGNSFALVGINALLHCIALIIAESFSSLAYAFLYGYRETNFLINAATEWNFIAYIVNIANRLAYNMSDVPFDWIKLVIMLVLALALYAAALLLYKKRRMETAEDVAAYSVLNPVYKYMLTFLFAVGTLAIFSNSLTEGILPAVFTVLLVSVLVYFAAEMLLKKSLRVWNAYKGYLAFLGFFVALICIFAFTSFFGFETRVPPADDVESVAIFDSYIFSEEPYLQNREIAEYAVGIHEKLVEKENISTLRAYPERSEYLHISYKLKNGAVISRTYPVTEALFCEVMDDLYKSPDYKKQSLELFSDTIGELYSVRIDHGMESFIKEEYVAELTECLRADLLELEYTSIRNHDSWSTSIGIEYMRSDEPEADSVTDARGIYTVFTDVNAGFTRTVSWLREHGYADEIFNAENLDLTVFSAEQWNATVKADEQERLKAASGRTVAVESLKPITFDDVPGAVRISDADAKERLRSVVLTTPVRYVPGKEYSYYVCRIDEQNHLETVAAFYDDAAAVAEFVK